MESDIGKGNLFSFFSFKQLMQMQVESEEDIDRPMQNKIELRIFGAR